MKKKFLVLGIGNAQLDLIERLSGHFEVHALSYSSDGPGLGYVDSFSMIDIADKDAVLAYSMQQGIDYIYSVGSDVAMPTLTYVAEKLGLPTLASYAAATTCANKAKLRSLLRDTYGAVAFEVLSDPQQETTVPLPAMIKPVDSQGQRGVQMITDRAEIPRAFDIAVGYSRIGKAILEEKIVGQEISVNGYMVNREMKFFLPSDREAWPQFDGGIIHKHFLPASLSEGAVFNVKRLVKATAATLGIENGPVYFQIKMRGDTPYLIEVTPRLDGCHMWRLIKFATGVDLLQCAISQLQGLPVTFPDELDVNAGMLEFFCQPPDERFAQIGEHPGAQHVEWYYTPDEKIRRMNGYMEKCGYQIIIEDKKG